MCLVVPLCRVCFCLCYYVVGSLFDVYCIVIILHVSASLAVLFVLVCVCSLVVRLCFHVMCMCCFSLLCVVFILFILFCLCLLFPCLFVCFACVRSLGVGGGVWAVWGWGWRWSE